MSTRCRIAVLLAVVVSLLSPLAGQQHSKLWGERGELWSPEGRLPDFSFAGYHFGEDPLPEVEVVANLRDFGAVGDGEHDDTAAFRRAIEATENGAILIPAGRYLVTEILWIEKPGVVLRGEGPDRTVLWCPRGLEQIAPKPSATTSGRPTSGYSWSGGMLWIKGNWWAGFLTAITSEARRGERRFEVESVEKLAVGQRVMLELVDDADKGLIDHLYSGDPGDVAEVESGHKIRMVSRIEAIEDRTVTLERPLRFDLRAAWKPRIRVFEPTVQEVGIEHLAIEFPTDAYRGHFTEVGFNGIAINGASDCWVRDVRISNGDSGVYLSGMFCSVEGLVLDSARAAEQGATGHHGLSMGIDCLATDCEFRTHFIHDITFGYLAAGNVVKNSKGVNLSLDHHKKAPYANLCCNLDVGAGTEIWRCGGGAQLGKHCGAHGTFWCIRSAEDLSWPWKGFGPDSMNLVGLQTADESVLEPDGKWFEAIPPGELRPVDLHAAQLGRRLAGPARAEPR